MEKQEEEKGEAVGEGEEAKTDAFGQMVNPPEPPKKPEEKQQEQGEDIEKNPLVIELRKQIKDYGSNLGGQGKVIKRMEKEIEFLKAGGNKEGGEHEPRFKEIKRSKDLTQEQKDEMTDAEIRQMDIIADMQETINELDKTLKGDKKPKEDEEDGDDFVQDIEKSVKSIAKELAKSASGKANIELANQIIESFNGLGFNLTKMTEEELKRRVTLAATQISEYKPPKEQKGTGGGAVKGGGDKTDPFGIDKIVEEATSGNNDGGYKL